jgi:hypothetical protein
MEEAGAICNDFEINFNKHHVMALMAKLEHENFVMANDCISAEDELVKARTSGDYVTRKRYQEKIRIAKETIDIGEERLEFQ